MTDPFDCGSDVHLPDPETDIVEYDPDDEVMEKTPKDVIAILGFDPLEDDDEEVEDEQPAPDEDR
jgi:hypothetical protein